MPVETRKRKKELEAPEKEAKEEPPPPEETTTTTEKTKKSRAKKVKEPVVEPEPEPEAEVVPEATAKKGRKGKKGKKEEEEAFVEEEEEDVKEKKTKKGASAPKKGSKKKEPEPEPEEEEDEEEGDGTAELEIGDSADCGDYTVRRIPTGYYTCNCKGFTFSKGSVKSCRHITELGYSNKGAKAAAKAKAKAGTSWKQPKLHTMTEEESDLIYSLALPGLKDLLRKNNQTLSGVKADLQERVVHCLEYGCYPNCGSCYTGRFKPAKEGGFYCSGYMNDDEWVHCGNATDGSDLTFPPFVM